MNAVTDFVKALGPSRIAAMGAVAVGLIGFFIFLAFRFSQPQMEVLYSDLAFEDSTEVVKRLESLNIPHVLRQEGAIVLVPKENVLKIRMKLAEEGLPAGGAVGYEIFDKGDTLGATSFVQNINQLRAIEGELSRTIRSLRQVQTARVHLVLPQRKLFSRKKAEPSASIVVKVRGTLDGGQIKAIRHLVASAVEDLKPSNVSIVDERGQLLASGQADGQDVITVEAAEDRNRAFEIRVKQQIENMLNSVVGSGHARVQVTAELDYKQTTQKSEIFDPEGQVVRSSETRNETSTSNQATNDGAVTVGNELPAAGGEGGENGQNTENSNKSHELINYAVSNTQKTEVVAAGQIKRISVAVLVDGLYTKASDGKVTYAPRSEEELAEIEKLVRSAIGYDKGRGDIVHISNLRFADEEAPPQAEAAAESMFELTKDDYFYIAELAITLIVALFVLLFVVRPLVRRILTPEEEQPTELLTTTTVQIDPETGQPIPQLEGAGGGSLGDNPDVQALLAQGSKTSDMLEVAKASGEIHATAIREVGEIIASNPNDAVNVIRDWMDADAA